MGELLEQGTWVDNVIIFHGGDEEEGQEENRELREMVKKLRQKTNPDLLFARVNIRGKPDLDQLDGAMVADQDQESNPDNWDEDGNKELNDLEISGFSDSVLQLLVSRGAGGQLAR